MAEAIIPVTQADREAAHGYMLSGDDPLPPHIAEMAAEISIGAGDHYQLTQAFAKHRTEAEQAMRERCAEEAEREAALYRLAQGAASKPSEKQYRMGQKDGALFVASAIRALPLGEPL